VKDNSWRAFLSARLLAIGLVIAVTVYFLLELSRLAVLPIAPRRGAPPLFSPLRDFVSDLRAGDRVTLSGSWVRGGLFSASRVDSISTY
jgi:hypothetical protein